jgi:hypothetical protein
LSEPALSDQDIAEAKLLAMLEIAERFPPGEDDSLSEEAQQAMQTILNTPVRPREEEPAAAFAFKDEQEDEPPISKWKDAAFGMVKGEWHGPTPPAPDWVLVRTGPKGGKVWRPSGQSQPKESREGPPPSLEKPPVATPAPTAPSPTVSTPEVGPIADRAKAKQELQMLQEFNWEPIESVTEESFRPRQNAAANPELPDSTRPSLTDQEKIALQQYTGPRYRQINLALRAGLESDMDDITRWTHQKIQEAFTKTSESAQPVQTYRGLKLSDPAQAEQMASQLQQAAQSQAPLALQGYVSTTSSREKFDKSYRGDTPGHFNFTIASKRGLDLSPVTGFNEEHELLLNNGSSVRVKSFQQRPSGAYDVELEEI